MVISRSWLLRLSVVALVLTTGDAASTKKRHRVIQKDLALAASSPFRMSLSFTLEELRQDAVELVQEVTAVFLLQQSQLGQQVKAVEIVIQSSKFQPDLLATRIKFFALATLSTEGTTPQSGSSSSVTTKTKRREDLNSLIEQSFSTERGSGLFIQLVLERASTPSDGASNKTSMLNQFRKLDNVQVVSVLSAGNVAPTLDESSSNSAGNELLSTLDIILVAVSASILIGISYMIAIHLSYRGIIVSCRRKEQNTVTFPFPPELHDVGFNVHEELVTLPIASAPANDRGGAYDSRHVLHEGSKFTVSEFSPSTPSTVGESIDPDFLFQSVECSDTLPSAPAVDDACTMDSMQMSAMKSASSSMDTDPDVTFGGYNWFHASQATDTSDRENSKQEIYLNSTDGNSSSDEFGVSDGSSDDVFHVDPATSDSGTGPPPTSEDISEWMNSMHVVIKRAPPATSKIHSTDGRSSLSRALSVVTEKEEEEGSIDQDCSLFLSSGSGSGSSLQSSMLEVSSLGQLSLEESMASSTPARPRSFSYPEDACKKDRSW